MFLSEEAISKEFKKAECPPELIKIEFEKPNDVLQLYKELKEKEKAEKINRSDKENSNESKRTTNNANKSKEIQNEELPSAEICISSNGDISLSFSNDMGSFQVTSQREIFYFC